MEFHHSLLIFGLEFGQGFWKAFYVPRRVNKDSLHFLGSDMKILIYKRATTYLHN
jgi:hypothetical protein